MIFSAFIAFGSEVEARTMHYAKATIDNVAQESYVTSIEGGITIYNASEITNYYIYSITGQLIKTVKISPDSSITIDLPQGYYIVRCQEWAHKILVK